MPVTYGWCVYKYKLVYVHMYSRADILINQIQHTNTPVVLQAFSIYLHKIPVHAADILIMYIYIYI